QPESRGHGRIL
nr:immunoglobulin heavy chain junction region [Homo sapiens]